MISKFHQYYYTWVLPVLFVVTLLDHWLDFEGLIFLVTLAAAVILIGLDGLAPRKLLDKKDFPIIIALIWIVLFCFVSQALYLINGIFYFMATGQHLANVLFFLIALYLYGYHRKEFNEGFHILSVIIWITAVVALVYFVGLKILTGKSKRLYWPYYDPIPSGTCWVVGFCLPISDNSRKDFILKLVYLPAVFLTQSRSSWLGLAFVIFLYLICSWKDIVKLCHTMGKFKTAAAAVALFAVLIMILQIPYIKNILVSRLFNITAGQGYTVRSTHAQYLLQSFINQNPIYMLLGHGPDSAGSLFRNSYLFELSGYDVVDNTFLSMLYEYGLLVIGAIFFIIWKMISLLVSNRYNRDYLLRNGILALAGAAVTAFFYDMQFSASPALLVMILSSITILNYRESKNEKDKIQKNGINAR